MNGFSAPLDIEDPAQLSGYLRASGRMAPAETARFTVLAGGVSNRAVLVERAGGEDWVLKQALEQLRVAVEWHCDPRRIEREAQALRWLVRLAPPGAITQLVFEDAGHHLLAMQAVARPHENWKTLLLAGKLEEALVEEFARLLATIHRAAWETRAEIAPAFADRSLFEALRLEPYHAVRASGQVQPPARD